MQKTNCRCIKQYIFHKTDTFPGVIFQPGEVYPVEFVQKPESNLIGVIHPVQKAHVGMSKARFAKHFVFV